MSTIRFTDVGVRTHATFPHRQRAIGIGRAVSGARSRRVPMGHGIVLHMVTVSVGAAAEADWLLHRLWRTS